MASNLHYKWFSSIIKASDWFAELSNGFHSALKRVPSVMLLEFGLRPGETIERLSSTFTANGKNKTCRLSSALCTVESRYLYLQ